MDYLKEEQYYIDLYDLFTIKQCLDSAKHAIKVPPQKPKGSKVKPISLTFDLFTYYVKGQRFVKKTETINEWINKDREKEERVKNATPPENVYCDFCSSGMDMTMRMLHDDDKRVLFWFECPNCKKRKAIYDNGEVYKSKPDYCPECSAELKETFKRKGDVLTTFIKCPNCHYKSTDVMDFEKDRKEWEEEKRKNKELLDKYRVKFCMNDKEGQEYISHVESMKQFVSLMKEIEDKKKDPAYEEVKKITKIKVNQLKTKLAKVLAKEKYVNLQFDKPQMDKFVVVPFTVEDSNNKREEYESRNICRRIIRKSLENTNWKLTSNGIEYRLGYLSGSLKGFEGEENLAEMVRQRSKDEAIMETPEGPIY